MTFSELALSDQLNQQLSNANITTASPLQQTIIESIQGSVSAIIEADDRNQTRTALAISCLQYAATKPDADIGFMLIAADDAEAQAICGKATEISSEGAHHIACITDAGSAEEQAEQLSANPPAVIATPERLQALIKEQRFIFRNVEHLVIDELHKIISEGNDGALKRIKRRILSDYTALICSGAYDGGEQKLAASFTESPTVFGFGKTPPGTEPAPTVPKNLKQHYINVPSRMKISTLVAHIKQSPTDRCMVFTASKRGSDRLYRVLKKQGKRATSLNAKLSDEKRAQRFANFKNNDVQFLLVADISAQELSGASTAQVINYDVPNTAEEYRFRAHLAASNEGAAIVSLVSKQDRSDIGIIQDDLGQTPEELPLPQEVKDKIKERKKKKKTSKSGGKRKQKSSRSAKTSSRSKKSTNNEPQLPKPSYEKLSGGRSGHHKKEENGFVKFFKKLFS